MKKLIIAVAIVFIATSSGFALTLQDFINSGSTGVTIAGVKFFDFSYAGSGFGGAAAIPATGITVNTITDPMFPGISFSAAWSVGPGQGLDSLIGFQVQVLDGARIKDISATMLGYGFVDGGTVSVAMNTFLGSDSLGNLFLFDNQAGLRFHETAIFDPTTGIIDVDKDIAVNGNLGVAAVSYVDNRFSRVPEPTTMLLFGFGLIGLAGVRRFSK